MPLGLMRSNFKMVSMLFTSGLLGVYEAIVEDSILFVSLGLVTIANPVLLLWIATVEFVGASQILLLLTRIEKGERLKSAISLWGLMIPLTMVCFLASPFLSAHINYLWIWGPVTAMLMGAFAVGFHVYVPHTKVPLGYATLTCGVIADFMVSSAQQLSHPRTTSLTISFDILLSTLFILTVTGVLLFSVGLIADHIQFKIDECAKGKIRKMSIPYLIALIGLIFGVFPPYAPLITFILTCGVMYIGRLAKILPIMILRSLTIFQTNVKGISRLFVQTVKPRNNQTGIFRMNILPLFKRKPLITLPVRGT